MAVLADFVVATEAEAHAYLAEAGFPPRYRSQMKRFTEIELGTLYHIAQGKEVTDDTLYDFRSTHIVEHRERMVTELIPDMVARLAAASDAQLAAWAGEWCQTAELLCDASDLIPVLEELRRLAKVAASEQKTVYLWNSF